MASVIKIELQSINLLDYGDYIKLKVGETNDVIMNFHRDGDFPNIPSCLVPLAANGSSGEVAGTLTNLQAALENAYSEYNFSYNRTVNYLEISHPTTNFFLESTLERSVDNRFILTFDNTNVDVVKPEITLLGLTTVYLEPNAVYNDAGATASDNIDGDITSEIVVGGTFTGDTSVEGTFNITYNVSDDAGNAADTVIRFIVIKAIDTTKPVISLIGSDTINLAVGSPYEELGATATDDVDGDITDDIVISGTVNVFEPDTYYKRYDVSDSEGNEAITAVRVIVVSDVTKPIIYLLGNVSVIVTQGATYNDAGATASDSNDGDLTGLINVFNDVDTNLVGSYIITYNVTDEAGNAADQVVRNVQVVKAEDVDKPVITLIGESYETTIKGETYQDKGATAYDVEDGTITEYISTINSVDTNSTGTYTVTYNVSDAAGNQADEVVRTVEVIEPLDTTKPVITIIGESSITITEGSTYEDQGATAYDNVDNNITEDIVTVNNVNDNLVGNYTVTYNVSDEAGNAANEVIRNVEVTAEVIVPTECEEDPNTPLNLPFGIYRSTRGDLDYKFRVCDDTARDKLIQLDLVRKGHTIFNESAKGIGELQYLKVYPTYGSNVGVEWAPIGNVKTNDETSISEETVPSSLALSKVRALVTNLEENNKGSFKSVSIKEGTSNILEFITVKDVKFELDITTWFTELFTKIPKNHIGDNSDLDNSILNELYPIEEYPIGTAHIDVNEEWQGLYFRVSDTEWLAFETKAAITAYLENQLENLPARIKIKNIWFSWGKNPTNTTNTLAIGDVVLNGRISEDSFIYSAIYNGGDIDDFGTIENNFTDGSYRDVYYEDYRDEGEEEPILNGFNFTTDTTDMLDITSMFNGGLSTYQWSVLGGGLDLNGNGSTIDLTGNTGNAVVTIQADLSTITELDMSSIGINSIDLSELTNLTKIDLDSNNLSTIDLTNNTLVDFLRLDYNNFTSIDLSGYTNLERVYMRDNSLTSIDFTNCTGLTIVDVSYNSLSGVPLNDSANLTSLKLSYNNLNLIGVNSNPLLTVLDLENNNLTSTSIDALLSSLNTYNTASTLSNKTLTIDDVRSSASDTDYNDLTTNKNWTINAIA